MQVTHKTRDYEFIGYSENCEILVANRIGSFLYLHAGKNNTKFNGLFYFDTETKDMIKTVNSMSVISGNRDERIIVNNLSCEYNGKFIFDGNSLVFTNRDSSDRTISINLDVRKIYDFEPWDRQYYVYHKDGNSIIAEYKRNDFRFFITFMSKDIRYKKVEKWIKEEYETDRNRNSPPFDTYTFDAMELSSSDHLIIGMGKTLEESYGNALKTYEKREEVIKRYSEENLALEKRYSEEVTIKDTRIRQAFLLASKSLDSLRVSISGNDEIEAIFAGLPWFFQFWTRDEAISTGGLISIGKEDVAKKILLRQIRKLLFDGRLGNRYPESALGSADGVGLAFFRLYQLMKDKRPSGNGLFSIEEMKETRNLLESSISRIKENYLDKNTGLIFNRAKETWMDTDETKTGEHDDREGYCIEIQALFASMLDFREFLYKALKERCKSESKEFKSIVQERFVNDGIIADRIMKDGTPDANRRPNIYLAYFFNESIFQKKTWMKTFSDSLDSIWLPWGGLATIGKSSKWFCSRYTGQDNHSYHRGDSWFFVNNIAAISMSRLDENKFQENIKKIIDASTADMLFNGIIGHASEISDAEELSSRASPAQAWSEGTYLEMISEIIIKK